MCDFTGSLVAWLDGELEEDEGPVVQQHIWACAECQQRVTAYEEVGRGFATYCYATLHRAMATQTRRKLPRWVPVVTGAAAALAAAILLVSLLPRFAKPVPAVPQAPVTHLPVASPPVVVEPATRSVQAVAPVQRRQVAAGKKAANANWAMADPAVQIAIPAEAMFPPGAVPEGVAYIANVSLMDGSVQGIRLQP